MAASDAVREVRQQESRREGIPAYWVKDHWHEGAKAGGDSVIAHPGLAGGIDSEPHCFRWGFRVGGFWEGA